MSVHERAGQPAQPDDLVDVARLVTAYYAGHPDPAEAGQQVAFGTSGHRGSSLANAVQRGPHRARPARRSATTARARASTARCSSAKDTHALSEPAWVDGAGGASPPTACTVLVDSRDGYTPTPALSHAILTHNRGRTSGLADGVVVTPSHNPPGRRRVQVQPARRRAGRHRRHRLDPGPRQRRCCAAGSSEVRRIPLRAGAAPPTRPARTTSSARTSTICRPSLDLDAIRAAGVRIGADPLGGASVDYWGEIAERHRLDLTVVNPLVDPTWRFMTLDWDGKIRMDCSSPYAMASLIARARRRSRSPPATTPTPTGTASSRPTAGCSNPNHYLAVAIEYLLRPTATAGRPAPRSARRW